GPELRLMAHGDKRDRGTDARAEDAEAVVAALPQPMERAANIKHGLAIRLHRQPDIRAHEMISARVAGDSAAVVIRQAHLDRRDSQAIQPPADVLLLLPAR